MAQPTRGVIYFNHGVRHCARLLVSLASLRNHYNGWVSILDTGESGGIIERIATDRTIQATVVRMPFFQMRRHSCYVTKTTLHKYTPFELSVFFDADTLIVGQIDQLFGLAELHGFVATQFSRWTCQSPMIKGRLSKWLDMPEPWGSLAKLTHESKDPAVNTGIFAFNRADPLLEQWHELARAGWRRFLPDELSMQILLHAAVDKPVLDDRWNASPIYGHHKDSAVVWHYHGSKHFRPEARPTWLPAFERCWRDNIACVRGWAPADDGALAAWLDEQATGGDDVEMAESTDSSGAG